MILVDTSIWIDHLRTPGGPLGYYIDQRQILRHPFVLGELAMGIIESHDDLRGLLAHVPEAVMGRDPEVLDFVERFGLSGAGIGYLDAHLLVSTRLTPGATLWTRDNRLRAVAERLKLNAKVAH